MQKSENLNVEFFVFWNAKFCIVVKFHIDRLKMTSYKNPVFFAVTYAHRDSISSSLLTFNVHLHALYACLFFLFFHFPPRCFGSPLFY